VDADGLEFPFRPLVFSVPKRLVETTAFAERLSYQTVGLRHVFALNDEIGENSKGLGTFTGLELVAHQHEKNATANVQGKRLDATVGVAILGDSVPAGGDESIFSLLQAKELLPSRFHVLDGKTEALENRFDGGRLFSRRE
jgi:hypothetical protein